MLSLLGVPRRGRGGKGKGGGRADETERWALALVGCCGGLRGGSGCLGARAAEGVLKMFMFIGRFMIVDSGKIL